MMLCLRPHDVSPVLSSLDDDRILHPRRACANGGRRHLPGRLPTVPLHQRHQIEGGRVHPHPIRRGLRVQRPRRVYAGLLGGGDVNVAGICAVQCGDGGGGQQQDMQRAFQCRLCDILACCSDCPSERASECFLPNVLNGYTPTGWEPLSCDGSNASSGGGDSSSGCVLFCHHEYCVIVSQISSVECSVMRHRWRTSRILVPASTTVVVVVIIVVVVPHAITPPGQERWCGEQRRRRQYTPQSINQPTNQPIN